MLKPICSTKTESHVRFVQWFPFTGYEFPSVYIWFLVRKSTTYSVSSMQSLQIIFLKLNISQTINDQMCMCSFSYPTSQFYVSKRLLLNDLSLDVKNFFLRMSYLSFYFIFDIIFATFFVLDFICVFIYWILVFILFKCATIWLEFISRR